MSKFFEMLQEEIKSNPRLQQLAQAAKRDGFALITAPERAVAGLTRAVGSGIEGVADLAGDVSEFIDRNAPRIEVGSGDSEIEIDPIGMQAKVGGAVAGLAEKAGEAVSKLKSPAESALEAMDRKIGALGGSGSGGGVARAGAKAAGAKPESFADLSEEEKEAFRKRRAERRSDPGFQKRVAGVKKDFERRRQERAARKAQQAGGGEESFEDFDPTGEEYDSAFDGSADSQGRSAFAPSETKPKRGTQRVASKPDSGPMDTGGLDPDDPTTFDGPLAAQGSEPDPPKAVPVDDAQAMDLFKTVHGGDFDPKSSVDKTKLAKIKENLTKDEYKGLTPNQFALRMYREAA